MNENELLLLGLLVNQSQHGYQLNEFIEQKLSHLTNMKKGNAYATLDRLCQQGLVSMQTAQKGQRPQRKIYTITSAGKEHFLQLLRSNLSQAERFNFAGDIGLMLLDYLPMEEVVASLEHRLDQLKARLIVHAAVPAHGHGIGVDLSLEHHLYMQKAEVTWLEQTIAKLSQVVTK